MESAELIPEAEEAQTCDRQVEDRTRARVTGYISDIFTTEEHLTDSVGLMGPTATNIAVTPMMVFYAGGVYYNPDECSDTAEEQIPVECQEERAGRLSFTCLNKVTPLCLSSLSSNSILLSERSQLRRATAGPLRHFLQAKRDSLPSLSHRGGLRGGRGRDGVLEDQEQLGDSLGGGRLHEAGQGPRTLQRGLTVLCPCLSVKGSFQFLS